MIRIAFGEVDFGSPGFRITDDEHAPVWVRVHPELLTNGCNAVVVSGTEAGAKSGYFSSMAQVWVQE